MEPLKIEVITVKQVEEFDRLLMTDPDMRKRVKKILSSVMSKARGRLAKDAKSTIDYDPRQAYRAVKRTIYKTILGGSLSILAKRRASSTRVNVEHERTLRPGQRGGNRRPRSARTEQVDSYFGADRGFILRFLNAGTQERQTRYGNRGSIKARNWFGTLSTYEMNQMAEEFCQLIEQEIKSQLDPQ